VAAVAALGLFGAACGDDEAESATSATSTSAVIDGELDCPADERLEPPAEVGGPGLPTPAEAIEALLGPTSDRLGGRIERIDETLGTLVVDGRELMRLRVRESDEGGWIGELDTAYGAAGHRDRLTSSPPLCGPCASACVSTRQAHR
jgi:hypothetical protein